MRSLLTVACLLALPLIVCAQQSDSLAELRPTPELKAVEPSRVYTYVEQMPELPGGGGQQSLAMDILKRLRLSGNIEPSCYRVKVYFEINSVGVVQNARITDSSQSAALDSSLLRAVRSLPTLRPGHQQGKPVTVSFTMPFNIATQ